MNKKTLAQLKRHLEKELEVLRSGVDCNFDGLKDKEDKMPDLIDRASSLVDQSLSQNICGLETRRAAMVERALKDIANGDYGVCERCGEDIAVKRLRVNPTTRHCIDCKTEIETRERLVGS